MGQRLLSCVITQEALHVPILAAIERRDAEGAREAMAAHMTGSTQRLLAVLEQQGQGGQG
ncbi:FCD domain-containing protein [Streptomyces caniscabiei]|uniref:FCD domain-containing protein n=1 Tax=Streptomyces caniscabiei TaxID=2746961 RepID=UPI000D183CEB